MKKYIILIFAVITFILSSCATGMRGYRYSNDYGYDTPGQGIYSYRYNRHRSHWWNRNKDYRNGRYSNRDYDYRYGDGDYDDYGYGNDNNYDRNFRYDDRYSDHHNRHRHHRLKGLVIVI